MVAYSHKAVERRWLAHARLGELGIIREWPPKRLPKSSRNERPMFATRRTLFVDLSKSEI